MEVKNNNEEQSWKASINIIDLSRSNVIKVLTLDYFCFSENVIQEICESKEKQLILDVITIA